ncbi:MAG TPA: hypothetical protein VGL81_32600 [Polyangiaceae bacterium]|jgi:hypothetical protein
MTPTTGLQRIPPALALAAMIASLSGCRVIGDIFKAGAVTGVVAVVIVLAVIGGIVALVSRGARG